MQTDVLFYILLLHKKRQHTDALSFKPTRQKRDIHSVKNLYLNLKLKPSWIAGKAYPCTHLAKLSLQDFVKVNREIEQLARQHKYDKLQLLRSLVIKHT
ncbi:unnamed protein product [Brassica oleracea]